MHQLRSPLGGDVLLKIITSFSSNVVIVCIDCDDQNRVEINAYVLNKHESWHVHATEISMPRFYFNLASKDADIPDNNGKELDTLHDAYAHARKLIDKILFRVGHDDAETWKVVIVNNEHDAQMIIPFSVSPTFRAQRRALADKAPKCDGSH